jgi:outer membrane lipoprotein SlyB
MNMKLLVAIAATPFVLANCAGDVSKQDVGTVVGGATGALIGSQIGSGSGRVVGAAVGGVAGAVVGSQIGKSMDIQDEHQHYYGY